MIRLNIKENFGCDFHYIVDRMYESTRQAFDRAKRSMKTNPKDRKLTLYSYRHTYGITRVLSTGDIYLVA